MKNEYGNELLLLRHVFKDQADSGVLQLDGSFILLNIGRKRLPESFYTPPPIGIRFPHQ
jgi:hypothetical protein